MIKGRRRARPSLVPLFAVALLTLACGGGDRSAGGTREGLPRGTLVVEAAGGRVSIDVEIAEEPRDQARGLMGRLELAPDSGMVFLEDRPVETGFWMKDTLIPLSIAFWGQDGRIFRIRDMAPCRADPCKVYEPGAPWVGAVEVNRGFFERHGVAEGDPVHLER
jgi:uncharacterized membrane protein (UPF0127 family)